MKRCYKQNFPTWVDNTYMTYELLGDDASFDNLVDFYVELSNFIMKLNSVMLSQYPQSITGGHVIV
jgi:hypothetical protein